MKLIELMNRSHRETFGRLKEKFPEMYEMGKEIEVIKWQDDFNVPESALGIAFIKEKQVSFKRQPSADLIIHELGHVYFGVDDIYWNSMYGGGEILLHLCLKGKIQTNQALIKWYHRILEEIDINPEHVLEFICEKIPQKLKVYPHLYTIQLAAGIMPNVDILPELMEDLQSEKWESIKIADLKSELFAFFQNMIAGLRYDDGFCLLFAKELIIIK